ncbi:MAG: ribonuclease HII [Minisyncoccia bacterium]|jgi:ribonuclease HII
MRLPNKSIEKKLLRNHYRAIVAVDEVGMGCLAGPVVVCAVMFDKRFFKKTHKKLRWLRDSKLLSAKQREIFAEELSNLSGLKFQICYCYPKTIDKLNIYQAARKAMRRAVLKVQNNNSKLKTIVLVDGPTKIVGLDLDQIAIVKGDRKVFAIACASIVAKVYRDKMMARYAKKYPNYGFEKHKGYGTRYHVAQLIALGPSAIHRHSFAPVSKVS